MQRSNNCRKEICLLCHIGTVQQSNLSRYMLYDLILVIGCSVHGCIMSSCCNGRGHCLSVCTA